MLDNEFMVGVNQWPWLARDSRRWPCRGTRGADDAESPGDTMPLSPQEIERAARLPLPGPGHVMWIARMTVYRDGRRYYIVEWTDENGETVELVVEVRSAQRVRGRAVEPDPER